MNQTIEWKKTQPASTEAVQFTDGMLVTADDLSAAMRYPLSVVQVLLKAWFGCGIVCGLDLTDPAAGRNAETGDGETATGANAYRVPPECYPNFMLTVEKGVALGCDGYPIEICGPLKLDLTPDPCRIDRRPQKMFIAARRITSAEASARACGCGSTGGETAQQCTRVRDHALVQAFDEDHLPAELCRVEPPAPAEGGEGPQRSSAPEAQPTGAAAVCACMKKCGDCACCGDPWVLLGTVMVGETGLGIIDPSGRRYVKPIACVCDQVAAEAKPKPEEKTTAAARETDVTTETATTAEANAGTATTTPATTETPATAGTAAAADTTATA